MGIQLSPPLLDGTIPAFYSTDQGIVITIPFSMNRVVSLSQVNGFQVKIKTVQSGNQLVSVRVDKLSNQGNEIKVSIPKEILDSNLENTYMANPDYSKFKVGQYYKVQVAYINQDTIGYYSSVAIGKYTTKPELSINHLQDNNLNSHSYSYTGIFDQSKGDKTERVYSYRFNLYNSDNKIVDTSGDLLHDTTKDDNEKAGQTEDTYIFSQDLELGETYRIEYVVTTTNGMIVASPRYRLMQKQSINPELKASLSVSLNYNNGYVDINLIADKDENGMDEIASGFFIIVRSCEDTNYSVWDEIHRLTLTAQSATRHLCRDFTVEQGKNYRYGVQQYNSNDLRSNRILSNIIYVDFEDAFLFDGKRQLKIKYNPKVSSFKKDLLETKTDTIGGKHPFIFRNGRVYYSEFPISGLISYQMDEENLFLSEEDYGLIEKTTNLTSDNIAAERTFKMKVLEWLTNGETKIFRSPTEGNYVVRLMNSSLSPNDTVGRMLHTFSSTAYEVAEFNYTTLGEMGFITIEDQSVESLQWETVEFSPRNQDGIITPIQPGINLLQKSDNIVHVAQTIRFDNMMPGDVIDIVFDGDVEEQIKIGITGSYYIDTGISIKSVKLNSLSEGFMTYSYYYTREPAFNTICDVSVIEMPQHQFIGEHDILTELLYVWDNNNEKWIKNPKLELIEIYKIGIEKRPLQRLDISKKDSVEDPFLIYELGTFSPGPGGSLGSGVSPSRPSQIFKLEEYYDSYNNITYKEETLKYEPYIKIDGSVISVGEIEETEYTKPGKLTELVSGNGVLVNLCYQMGVIKYNLEDDAVLAYNQNNEDHFLYRLGEAIINHQNAQISLEEVLNNEKLEEIKTDKELAAVVKKIEEARAKVQSTYNTYIIELVKGQNEDARRKGEIA